MNTTEVDIKKSSRMKNPHKTRKVGHAPDITLVLRQQFRVYAVKCFYIVFVLCFFLWFQSVYGLQNDIRTHSPTHTPAPEAKQPTEEELQEQVDSLIEPHF